MDIGAHNRKGYNGKQLKKTEFCIVAVQRMGEKQMKIRERGVLAESEIYFHTPSEMARRMFFYLRCTGRYLCDETYAVQRQSYNSFLILYVVRGQGCCYVDDERVPLSAGHFALLDCYRPHRYGTDTGWEILWIHYDGVLARDYYEAVVNTRCQVIFPQNPYALMRGLERIYRMYHHEKRANEALISKNIVNILTGFLTAQTPGETGQSHSAAIEELLSYITENIDQPLSLEELARRASLSPFYFSRVFKRETGYTLREYLLKTRVNRAKFYLKTTSLSLKEISYRCGYGSESTFCTTFRHATGLTPMGYRSSSL